MAYPLPISQHRYESKAPPLAAHGHFSRLHAASRGGAAAKATQDWAARRIR